VFSFRNRPRIGILTGPHRFGIARGRSCQRGRLPPLSSIVSLPNPKPTSPRWSGS
jgi:hypothetical protein